MANPNIFRFDDTVLLLSLVSEPDTDADSLVLLQLTNDTGDIFFLVEIVFGKVEGTLQYRLAPEIDNPFATEHTIAIIKLIHRITLVDDRILVILKSL